jgi:hypothetical protein
MGVFDTEMHQNGFFFRNLHEKLGKKMLWNNFFLVIWGSNVRVIKLGNTFIQYIDSL